MQINIHIFTGEVVVAALRRTLISHWQKYSLGKTLHCKIQTVVGALSHLPNCLVDPQVLRGDLLGVHAGVGGDVEDEHLVEEGEGHDQEQGAEQDVQQPLLILPEPPEFVNDVIKVAVRHCDDNDGAESLLFLRASLNY